MLGLDRQLASMAQIPSLGVIPVSHRILFLPTLRVPLRQKKQNFRHPTDITIAVENLNQWYAPGDQAYIIVASAMVLVMIPGLGFLYSGLARRKSALTMLWITMATFSVITFQWYLWGYSLAFSAQGTSGFIGDLKHFGLMNTLGAPSPGSPLIPELLYSFYQVRLLLFLPALQNVDRSHSCNSAPPQQPLQQVL